MDAPSLTAALKQRAFQLGFDLAEAAPVPIVKTVFSHLERWLGQGYAGEMRYFADRLDAYRDPNLVLKGVKSVLMLGMNYRTVEPIAPQAGQGRVSRYAWGADYHDLIHERLRQLVDLFQQLVPSGQARGVVDTAPFLERSFAARAGLGWIGKNTTLINREFGSWIFLAALLTTEDLTYSPLPLRKEPGVPENSPLPLRKEPGVPENSPLPTNLRSVPGEGLGVRADSLDMANPCGNCHACLDACPTGALTAPYQLDARKCISYLTIEHRGEIPEALRSAIGDRLFGCDACQEACPWNRRTPATAENALYPREGMNPVDLDELENLDEESFRRRFRHTPLWRAKFEGILRNAVIVKANHHCE